MSAPDPVFDALVSAGPLVDNASDRLYAIGELEYDGPRCGRCGDTPVVDEDTPCTDCLTEIGDDQWACPRCPAHWYRTNQTHDAWAARLPVVQAAHLARHDREEQRCTVCHGAGGWQQHDGLIVECPNGCMTGERAA